MLVLGHLSNLQGAINLALYDQIKGEINWLLETNFIKPCRYAQWISNIVPMEKKSSDKIRVCIDFKILNRATLKDEYLMPIDNEYDNYLCFWTLSY
jgi:hypothetical protein